MEHNKNHRPAANHPAIQNLRWFLKDYIQSDKRHSLRTFAFKLDRTRNELGRYLRGEVTPRRKMIESWAEAFGVDYEYMMRAEFPYINYPFNNESTSKKGGRHITMREVKRNYDEMYEEISTFVGENDDFEYGMEILEILKRYKI